MKGSAARWGLVAVIALIAAGVVGSVWGTIEAEKIDGPSRLVQEENGNIWLVFDRNVFRLDQEGSVRQTIPFEALGVERAVADLVPDGAGGFWFGDMATKEISHYSETGTLTRGFAIKETSARNEHGTFKFVVHPDSGQVIVSDAIVHRLVVFDRAGEKIRTVGSDRNDIGQFHFPNDLRFGPDGLLYVADTNNHRIVRLDPAFSRVVDAIKTSVPGWIWPTTFAFLPEGWLVVLNKDNDLRGGQLAFISPEGVVEKTTDFEDGADPEYIVVRSDDLLVTDRDRMEIVRFTHDGERLGYFGSQDLTTHFEELRSRRQSLLTMVSLSRIGLVVVLGGLVVVLAISRRNPAVRETTGDPLPNRFDIRPLPPDAPAAKGRVYLIASIVLLLAGLALWAAALFSRLHETANVQGVRWPFFLLVLLGYLGLLGAVFSFLFAAKHGVAISWASRYGQRMIARYGGVLTKLLARDEKIRLYSAIRISASHQELLLVLTTHRALMLYADALLWAPQRIREVDYGSIADVEVETPKQAGKVFRSMTPGALLTIRLQESSTRLTYLIVDARLAESIKAEILERKQAARGDFRGVREICPRCLNTIGQGSERCARCLTRAMEPGRALRLSLLFPGLGQFANNSVLKGVIFLAAGVLLLSAIAYPAMILFYGTSEVSALSILTPSIYLATLWAISAWDAHRSAR
jgi:hypothetical protein